MSNIESQRAVEGKRIFYCNITYGCNSNCIFCYSHNTQHNRISYKEIAVESFIDYLRGNGVDKNDRIIVNGGEPLLHYQIESLLMQLNKFGCEVLIYTNGRLLKSLNPEILSERFRFVIPIHGYQELHDRITGINGSYNETIQGLQALINPSNKCQVDIKLIINNEMINDYNTFKMSLESLKNVPLNNAVHITKMADTIISKRNNCESINDTIASEYTREIYEYYAEYYADNYKIKIFDTCIKGMKQYIPNTVDIRCFPKAVYFKDLNQESTVDLKKTILDCEDTCSLAKLCQSAVGEYTVLEFFKNEVYIELE